MLFPISLLILFVIVLVLAYFASRTWHWAHVLLVVALFMATIGYLVLAAETLRIRTVLGRQIEQRERQLAVLEPKIEALERGTREVRIINQLIGDELSVPEDTEVLQSIRELDHKLHLETRRRGRVWRGVTPAAPPNPQTGVVTVSVESPNPPGLETGSILYLFEQGEPALPDPTQGAQYLGEFRVTNINGNQLALEPVLQLDDFEKERLARSTGPWIAYENIPSDRHDLFTGVPEEQLRQWFPEESVEEYIRHGGEAGPDDDEWHRVGFDAEGNRVGPDDLDQAVTFRYERALRDYEFIFHGLARQRVLLLANIEAAQEDIKKLQQALASARELLTFRQEELARLQADQKGLAKERTAIDQLLATVESQVVNGQALLDEKLQENVQLAQLIVRLQSRWADQINRQAPAAGSGAGAIGPLN